MVSLVRRPIGGEILTVNGARGVPSQGERRKNSLIPMYNEEYIPHLDTDREGAVNNSPACG
jgi:hypothetical protein